MRALPDVHLTVDGRPVTVAVGATVAAALGAAGVGSRRSLRGEPRGPLCGMGICYECRVTVDGMPHRLACQLRCREGMAVVTG